MKKLEKQIKKYLTERSWDNLKPGDVAKSISIEAAELLELFQWVNPTKDSVLKDEELLKKIRLELADVFIYALDMAVILNLDTEELVLEKLALAKKKYPAKLFKQKATKGYPGNNEYYKIKEAYREKKSN